MHFALVTLGTRGDVQPFVALGARLQRHGHRATIVTHEDYRALVEGAGLALRSAFDPMRELLQTPDGQRWVESSDNVLEYGKALKALFGHRVDPWARHALAALADADVVVSHPFAGGAMLAAHKRDVPLVVLSPYPSLGSRRIAMAPSGEWPIVGPWINRMGWRLFERIVWKTFGAPIHALREEFGLPKLAGNIWDDLRERRTPYLHCYSESLLPRPDDWPAFAEVTGWCTLDAPSKWSPPSELKQFLDCGEAVYIGFGSMTGMDQSVLARITLGAIRRAGLRAVIGGGWGSLSSIETGNDVLYVDDVPHDWLFPRMRAVIHHGGAGTVAAGLRAGKPTLVVPFFGDQPLWGRRVHQLGIGPPPLFKRRLTEERLAQAMTALCSDTSFAERAAALGDQLRREDGTERTAARLLSVIAR